MNANNQSIEQAYIDLSKRDALSEAEKVTGKSYKESDATSLLGMAVALQLNKQKDKLLDHLDDTKFSNTVPEYLRKLDKVGFKVVYQEDFTYTPDYGARKPQDEKMYMLFNYQHSILILFDTFHGNVNGAIMFYNWAPNSIYYTNGCTSSGHFMYDKEKDQVMMFSSDLINKIQLNLPKEPKWTNGLPWDEYRRFSKPIEEERNRLYKLAESNGARALWSGYHDAREGVISTINQMLKYGQFYKKWHDCPFSWLTNFAEHKGDISYPFTTYEDATRARISKLPVDVQNVLAPYKQ